MNTSNKLVSVIIPTYKRSDSLCATIDSVLKQTYSNVEIIVVDDNGRGTECQLQTEERLEEYISSGKIQYITHEVNKNGSAARNTGFKVSKGSYINFMDDDDKMKPNFLESEVTRLKATDDKVGACYCNSIIKYIERGKTIFVQSDLKAEGNLCFKYLTGKYLFNTSAIVFKRSAIEQLNGFDESFRRHQDYELMTRFFCDYKICCAGEDALISYDLTEVRTYTHNAEKDFELKKKFLTELKSYLNKLGIYKEIAHYFWFTTMQTAVLSNQFSYIFKAGQKSLSYGCFTLTEIILISKLIIKHCIRRVYNH